MKLEGQETITPKNLMHTIKAWIVSFRLRTLPLALSSIFMGSLVAAHHQLFSARVLLWASITTLFLQVLSNLSNDYGDAVSGADNAHRKGPQRMIQTGVISLRQMKGLWPFAPFWRWFRGWYCFTPLSGPSTWCCSSFCCLAWPPLPLPFATPWATVHMATGVWAMCTSSCFSGWRAWWAPTFCMPAIGHGR